MKLIANMMVLNERPFLSAVIPALHRFVDRIVIVDNESTDHTRDLLMDELLNPEDDLIFARQDDPPNFGKQRNIALDATEAGAWVLKWDADELPSEAMVNDLKAFLISKEDRYTGWNLSGYHIMKHPRKALAFEYGFPHMSLFRNDPGIRWREGTHELPLIGHPQGGINPKKTGIAIIHFSYWCEKRFARKAKHYASIPDSGFKHPSQLTDRLKTIPKPLPENVTYVADPQWLEEIREMD